MGGAGESYKEGIFSCGRAGRKSYKEEPGKAKGGISSCGRSREKLQGGDFFLWEELATRGGFSVGGAEKSYKGRIFSFGRSLVLQELGGAGDIFCGRGQKKLQREKFFL